MSDMQTMLDTIPQIGTVRWLSFRSAARSPVTVVESLEIVAHSIVGDHFSGKAGSKRQVTLIGGYNAMRGHGGITASVVESGTINVGDYVQLAKPGD